MPWPACCVVRAHDSRSINGTERGKRRRDARLQFRCSPVGDFKSGDSLRLAAARPGSGRGDAFAAADTYVVVLALPDMMGSVGLSIDQLQRAAPIVSGFLLGYVAMLPLIGRIADLRGRTPVLVAALVVFAFGSLVTAAAYDLAEPGDRPLPPGRRRRRAGAGDPRAGRRPLPGRPTRRTPRRGRRRAGARQRPRPAVRRRGALLRHLARHLLDQPRRRPGPRRRHRHPGAPQATETSGG